MITIKTPSGTTLALLPFRALENYSGYDRSVADTHIMNCGSIVVYPGTAEPVDNEYLLNEAYDVIEKYLSCIDSYRPSSWHFTTSEDVDKVIEALYLSCMNLEELHTIRDMVVSHYDSLYEKMVEQDRDEAYEIRNAMMSVTAVIDHCKLSAGATVDEI